MKTVYLVIDHNHPQVAWRYRIFEDENIAMHAAVEAGYEDPMKLYTDKIGYMNMYQCGSINVGIVKLLVGEKC